jgi:hypothetical protein
VDHRRMEREGAERDGGEHFWAQAVLRFFRSNLGVPIQARAAPLRHIRVEDGCGVSRMCALRLSCVHLCCRGGVCAGSRGDKD